MQEKTTRIETNPCPFCGKRELIVVVVTICYTWVCRCMSCGASGPIGSINPEGAYKKWNERYMNKEQDHDRPNK